MKVLCFLGGHLASQVFCLPCKRPLHLFCFFFVFLKTGILLKAGCTDGLCASNAFRIKWAGRRLPLPKFKKNHKNFSPLNPC